MRIVVDASVVVALLVDDGPTGRWAESVVTTYDLVAPHLLPVEVANVLRRAVARGHIADDPAALAHVGLAALPIELVSYRPFAERVWELRGNLSTYDAWYVAVAETLGVELATLDRRIVRAPGPRCGFNVPEVH